MWRKRAIILFFLALILSTPIFGQVETALFSAYAACRKAITDDRLISYGIWKPERTSSMFFESEIIFSDRINNFSCIAIGIGPFWIAKRGFVTIVGCGTCDGNPRYYGVSP
jgi:hypothetical protein